MLWYPEDEDLREHVILNPQWVMDAVYRMIDDNEIQGRNGIIQKSDFNRLWGGSYTDHHFLLKAMLDELIDERTGNDSLLINNN